MNNNLRYIQLILRLNIIKYSLRLFSNLLLSWITVYFHPPKALAIRAMRDLRQSLTYHVTG